MQALISGIVLILAFAAVAAAGGLVAVRLVRGTGRGVSAGAGVPAARAAGKSRDA